MKKRSLLILALIVAIAVSPAFARKVFIPVEGGEFVVPVDMSADATKIVMSGYFGAPYFLWTEEDGLIEIGGGSSGGQVSISDDGSTIVGNDLNADGIGEAAKWLGGTEWQTMGSEPGALPCGATVSSAYDTNNDTAVGLFWRAQLCKAIGGTWDVVAGMAGPEIPSTVPNRPTRGNAITNDGTIIGGWQDSEFGSRYGAIWVNGVQQYVLDDDGANMGEVIGMNSDGSVMWGTNYRYNGTGLGWVYREGEGIIGLGRGAIGGNTQSVPIDATEDGSVVVGIARDFIQFIEWGFIWTEKKGYQDFDEFFKGQTAAGWTGMVPSVISPDGNVIAGRGFNPDGVIQAWIYIDKANQR
jgi:hypothetical protein